MAGLRGPTQAKVCSMCKQRVPGAGSLIQLVACIPPDCISIHEVTLIHI